MIKQEIIERGKTMNGATKLTDDRLDMVSGGYVETFGFAMGSDIVCPNPKCRTADKDNFKVFLNLDTGMNDYTCLKCGWKFSLD